LLPFPPPPLQDEHTGSSWGCWGARKVLKIRMINHSQSLGSESGHPDVCPDVRPDVCPAPSPSPRTCLLSHHRSACSHTNEAVCSLALQPQPYVPNPGAEEQEVLAGLQPSGFKPPNSLLGWGPWSRGNGCWGQRAAGAAGGRGLGKSSSRVPYPISARVKPFPINGNGSSSLCVTGAASL